MNERSDLFDERIRQAFGWPTEDSITWLSPLAADEFAEYRDHCFLDRLGVQPTQRSLDDFWPRLGPRWDGLGVAIGDRPLLVEAKAYVEEANASGTEARGTSLALIHQSLDELKADLRTSSPHDRASLFYQYTNRLAHLYFLRESNGIDAYMAFVYFSGAPDLPADLATSEVEWRGANRLQRSLLGLPRRHRLDPYVAEILIDVGEL